ncbi:hypothetical protein KAW38_02000 [Candidatus Micrarchaeota archaeon]|nr:hypothetical protein [Candidatus Micrarchaeota archaeon]
MKEQYIEPEELQRIIEPLVKPRDYLEEEVKRCEKELIRLYNGHKLGRMRIVHALLELGIEPCEVRNTKFGRIALPVRTIKEAWKMVMENEGLIKTAAKVMGYVFPFSEDVLQTVREHMFIAALFWDKNKAKFSTYFFSCLGHCKRQILKERYHAKVPVYIMERLYKLYKMKKKFPWKTNEEIAEKLGISEEELGKLKQISRMTWSHLARTDLDFFLYQGEDDMVLTEGWRKKWTLSNRVLSEELVEKLETHKQIEESLYQHELENAMEDAFKVLSLGKKMVLKKRFGFEDDKEQTLQKVGDHFGVTRQRVEQIEKIALKKLRGGKTGKKLKAFLVR